MTRRGYRDTEEVRKLAHFKPPLIDGFSYELAGTRRLRERIAELSQHKDAAEVRLRGPDKRMISRARAQLRSLDRQISAIMSELARRNFQ